MKYLFSLIAMLFSFASFAQKPCEYSSNINDSIGTYKSTKEYLISEKKFGGNSSYIFFSLAITDGLPTLNLQQVEKSKDFIKANCFDKNSKLILQLSNGKIISLIHVDQENCGTMLRDDKGFDNRVNSGVFMFPIDSFADLKSATVTLMRIKYLTATEDYVFQKEFKSELTNETYYPESYFINYLKCVE